MKTFLITLLLRLKPLLDSYRKYRKWYGGHWYKVEVRDEGGWSAYTIYWTQWPHEGQILQKEDWGDGYGPGE